MDHSSRAVARHHPSPVALARAVSYAVPGFLSRRRRRSDSQTRAGPRCATLRSPRSRAQ
ncbi:hypothetical protein B005_4523 [Nocardiopsis alba ATCC BAA-2165]|uniref:Uncharacterized protein n=1 Tax=Nocardiopsis alba (strain ATCC BAA-2165 / BE74) TaxID=1205910 RepID=J7L9H0_NOCAA|nr:hypothetical protein B005_4523 [Nocardiopsis alba ATCC BAA-2165]